MTEFSNPFNVISPPLRCCPACSKHEFGILLIDANRYKRRCRNCSHEQYFPLPRLRKKIIYLDQFVVSNLMKLNNPGLQRNDRLAKETFWMELRDVLLHLREMQLICCPSSGSHEAESRISLFNDELKKTYEALSGGIRFKSFDHISADQIIELGLAWSESREPQFDFDPGHVLTRDPNEWAERFYIVFGNNPFVMPEELQQARCDIESHISHLFKDVWAKEEQTFEYWYELERLGYQGHLSRVVVKSQEDRIHTMLVLACRAGEKMPLEDIAKIMPSPAEALENALKQIMRFRRDGGERSPEGRDRMEKSFGDANRISEAPFVKLQALMCASLAMRAAGGQTKLPDEGTNTDIETVAHLLPYCDAMLMDNVCRSLLLNVPMELRPAEAAKVFSPNVKEKFLAYLQSIQDGVTAEHIAALREVYGDDHLE